MFRIIITLFHDEVHFLYVTAEFKQFIPLALILLVNLMNKKMKKKGNKQRKGATLAGGAKSHFDPEMNLQENHKRTSVLPEELIIFFCIVIQNI